MMSYTYIGIYNDGFLRFPFIIRNVLSNSHFIDTFYHTIIDINSIEKINLNEDIKNKQIISQLFIFNNQHEAEIFWISYFTSFVLNYIKEIQLKEEEEIKRKEKIWLSFLNDD
jgi:hypothetical protein